MFCWVAVINAVHLKTHYSYCRGHLLHFSGQRGVARGLPEHKTNKGRPTYEPRTANVAEHGERFVQSLCQIHIGNNNIVSQIKLTFFKEFEAFPVPG